MNAELPPFKNGKHNSKSASSIDSIITPLIIVDRSLGEKPGVTIHELQVRLILTAGKVVFFIQAFSKPLILNCYSVASEHHGTNGGGPSK